MNTILGSISAAAVGRTLPHEHILVGSSGLAAAFGDRWFDRRRLVELAVCEIEAARDGFGINTIIDGTAVDICRDLELLREVSLRTGVNIPYCTGLYYFELYSYSGKKPEEFAKYFIDECNNGSSMPDGSVGASRPAFLKCATDALGVTPINRIELATMAITQRETGLPLYCHNCHRIRSAYDQLKVLEEYGADLSKVIIGHTSDTVDVAYLTDLLEKGCFLSFDRIRPNADNNLAQTEAIAALVRAGYADRMMLSHDHCVFIDFGNADFERTYASSVNGGYPGFTYIGRVFVDRLKAQGVSDAEIETMMTTAVASAYCV